MRHLRAVVLVVILCGFPLRGAQADISSTRAWFDSLRLDDRVVVQFSLILTDNYFGLADGFLRRNTYEALLRFQRRNRFSATGVLRGEQQDVLLRQASQVADFTGFKLLSDPAAGLRLGVPLALLSESSSTETGTKWSRPDGEAEMQTIRVPTADLTFEELHAKLSADDASRRVTYDALESTFFVLSGTADGKRFYSRFTRAEDGTRGFSLSWAPEYDGLFKSMAIAISNVMSVEAQMPAIGGPVEPPDAEN